MSMDLEKLVTIKNIMEKHNLATAREVTLEMYLMEKHNLTNASEITEEMYLQQTAQ